MAASGVFDPRLIPLSWWDDQALIEGWFDPTNIAEQAAVDPAIAGATSATAVSTAAGTQVQAGAISSASSATTQGPASGSQVQPGTAGPAVSATFLSSPSGTQIQVGAIAGAVSATSASNVEGAPPPPPPPPPPAPAPKQFFWTGADIARMNEQRERRSREAALQHEIDIDEEAIGVLIAAIH